MTGNVFAAAAIALAAGVTQADSPAVMPPAQYVLNGPLATGRAAGPDWAKSQPLYQAYPHDGWSQDYTAGSYFRRTEALLPALKEMGVGVVWLIPVHPRGPAPGAAPPPRIVPTAQFQSTSPYCVRDYYAVDPHWGTPDDLHHLIRQAHKLGMHVMMDMVLNHTSWGNPLLTQHTDFYKKDADGDIVQADGWRDVAQLDYGNRAVWDYMRDMLTHWVRDFDVDGFRMDAAGMIPQAFWQWLRPQLLAVKPVLLLAEDDSPRDYPAFDMTYDWSLQPLLWRLGRGGPDSPAATVLDVWLLGKARDFPPGAVPMNHLDNHDLNREDVLARYGDGYRAFSVLTATLPGRPMVYNGQEPYAPGDRPPMPIPDTPQKLRRARNYDFFRRLLNAYRQHPALQEGEFVKVPSGHDEAVYAFVRRRGRDQALVVLNLSARPQQATLQSDALPGRCREVFTDTRHDLTNNASLSLEPWAYRLYVK
ncbi:MAG: alpha-glucosidase C-terminal domain-containing protein [Armatimonadetes bacterium]|nr:alpha-glucosidase C-terminal domain-containing protein [Armatimonadota bacterium]